MTAMAFVSLVAADVRGADEDGFSALSLLTWGNCLKDQDNRAKGRQNADCNHRDDDKRKYESAQ